MHSKKWQEDAILPVDLIYNGMGFAVDCNTEYGISVYDFELFMMCHFFCCRALPFWLIGTQNQLSSIVYIISINKNFSLIVVMFILQKQWRRFPNEKI